jgi:hypothetical protein
MKNQKSSHSFLLAGTVFGGTAAAFVIAGWLPNTLLCDESVAWWGATNIYTILCFYLWPAWGGVLTFLHMNERLFLRVAKGRSDAFVFAITTSAIAGSLSFGFYFLFVYWIHFDNVVAFLPVPLLYTATIVIGSRFVKWEKKRGIIYLTPFQQWLY